MLLNDSLKYSQLSLAVDKGIASIERNLDEIVEFSEALFLHIFTVL